MTVQRSRLPAATRAASAASGSRRSHPRALAAVRICFGIVWLTDAAMKWSPQFTRNFVADISAEEPGQPGVVRAWLRFWVSLLQHNGALFAHLLAVAETLLAIALILGAFTQLACVAGGVLSLLIWSTAEAFGGPYGAGSTDVGTSIVYVIAFALVAASGAGGWAALDRRLRRRFGVLCARPIGGVAPPSPVFVATFTILTAIGLAAGLYVAFAATALPPSMVM